MRPEFTCTAKPPGKSYLRHFRDPCVVRTSTGAWDLPCLSQLRFYGCKVLAYPDGTSGGQVGGDGAAHFQEPGVEQGLVCLEPTEAFALGLGPLQLGPAHPYNHFLDP